MEYQGWESTFAKKVSEWAIRSKSEQFAHSLIFVKQPEQFANYRLFLLSDLSESLTVTHLSWATWAIHSICSEGMSKANILLFLKIKKQVKRYIKYDFWANRLFLVSERENEQFAQKKQEICSFTHLSWVTWAIRSLRSEGMSKPLAFLKLSKNCKKHKKIRFFPIFLSKSLYFW